MAYSLKDRAKNAWNAFFNARDPTVDYYDAGYASSYRPDRVRYTRGAERSIIASIYNRISNDVAAIDIRHVKLDEDGRFLEEIDSDLNNCFSTEANVDQTGRAFIQDVVASMLDEGCVAIVPEFTSKNPAYTDSYDIFSLRVGKIVDWRPYNVKVNLYNVNTGKNEDVVLEKRNVGIVENPFYSIMNEPNSSIKRLNHKLNLLDKIDNDIGANKLDMIIQLPYLIKSDSKKRQAEERRNQLQRQLEGSKYGVAYIDGTEKITQLNRPIENTLLGQIEYLTKEVYAQLGMTQEILNGSADEKTMLNYQSRMIKPILNAIVEEMQRKFLGKTARSQRQAIKYFVEPFSLVPVSQMAEIADKFTRNEIMTSNEIRQSIGMKPSNDPSADELRNKNLSAPKDEQKAASEQPEYGYEEYEE